jgi:hypothetical protein
VSVAWDNFIASLDVAELERERMRVLGSLDKERPGSWEHHHAMERHRVRRLAFRVEVANQWVPFWWHEKQAQIAQDAMRGPVSLSAGRVASPATENTSTTVKPANGRTDSQVSSTDKWIPVSEKRKEAA